MATKEDAVKLAKKHFKIHPLQPDSKLPYIQGWQNKATDNLEQVSKWWDIYPNANIGILTGGNLVVIDVDNKDGKDGSQALSDWCLLNGSIPPTFTVKTPSGGYHYYYMTDNRFVKNAVDVLFKGCGIDIRGNNGYVVAPLSTIDGVKYEVISDMLPRTANENVYALCEGRANTITFDLPSIIEKGTRDVTIFKYACSLQAKGYFDNEIYNLVHKANDERCNPPLSDREVNIKINSALKYKKGEKTYTNNLVIPKVRTFADIEEKAVDWLWYPYIPRGMLTALGADPGTGKTFLCCYIAYLTSVGKIDNNPFTGPITGNILMFNSEDSPSTVLKPRLRLLGADLSKIIAPENTSDPNFIPYSFDDNRLEILFDTYKPVLAFFDPIQSYLGAGVDMHRANETRPLFAKLQALAERHNTAIVIVSHMNKMTTQDVYYRFLGSIDFMGAVRSALFLGKHPKDKDIKVMFHIKQNGTPPGDTLAYRINNGVWMPDALTDVSELTPEDCTGQKQRKAKTGTKKDKAIELINKAFDELPPGTDTIEVSELKQIAEDNDIDWQIFARNRPNYITAEHFGKGENQKHYWKMNEIV